MVSRILALVICLGVCSQASATLMVGTSANTVVIAPSGTVSQTLQLQSSDSHLVTGGRMVLMIQPIGAATGGVQFNTALPGFPNGAITDAQPSKYLITTALNPVPGNPIYSAGNTMANVFWTGAAPGQTPVTANDPLLTMNYTASAGTNGTFGLYLVQDTSQPIGLTTHWRGQGTGPAGTSSLGSPFDMTFDPLSGKVLIGTITTVPEPGSFALMGLIGLVIGSKVFAGWWFGSKSEASAT